MKYFSRKVERDGETYDSTKEYYRHKELQKLEKEGKISSLERQVRFEILPRMLTAKRVQLKTKVKEVTRVDEKAKFYTADFVYHDEQTGLNVVEDVKSIATSHVRDYPLRRHLMKMKLADMSTVDERWKFIETI